MIRPLIRRGTPADLPAVADLEAEIFAGDPWSESALAELVSHAGRDWWVATDEAPESVCAVSGYALIGRSGEVAELLRLGVRPAARRQGLARDLLGTAVDAAAAAGAERMLLEVAADNEAALPLYRAAGFDRIDVRRRYYRDGTDALVLEASLAGLSNGRLDAPERMGR